MQILADPLRVIQVQPHTELHSKSWVLRASISQVTDYRNSVKPFAVVESTLVPGLLGA